MDEQTGSPQIYVETDECHSTFPAERSRVIIRLPKAQQRILGNSDLGFARRTLSPEVAGRQLDLTSITLAPGARTQDIEIHRRGLEQYVHVLGGTLGVEIAGQQVLLEEGDTLYFQADTRYAFEALGSMPCRYLTLIDASRVKPRQK